MDNLAAQPETSISAADVRAACDRIVSSPAFASSDRMIRFLRFVVEKTLAGEQASLKEYTLGVEVFDRPESFDPKIDTIVRVEARRLRRKLKEYYDGPGTNDAILIDLPSPGYVPAFLRATKAVITETPPVVVAKPGFRWRPLVIFAAAAVIPTVILWQAWHSRAAGAGLSSVAVLPFVDLSEAHNQEYFCDGVTEQVIDALASVEGLRVVARTSTFQFKSKAGDVREIGRKLGAEAVLEGSVRRAGDRVRVTVQLIKTADGYHLWSHTIDRDGADLFRIQDDISRLVVQQLKASIAGTVHATAAKSSLEAYDLYFLGRHHWSKLQPDHMQKAIEYYEKAIALDPKFALAWSGLSEAYSYMNDMEFAPASVVMPKAKEAANRAVELDPNLAEAHTSLGIVACGEYDWALADAELRKAMQLKPSYAYGIHWYAHSLEYRGRTHEALDWMKKALTLDPLSPMINGDLAFSYYLDKQYDASVAQAKKALALGPDALLWALTAGYALEAKGDDQQALNTFLELEKQLTPMPFPMNFGSASAKLKLGDRRPAEELASKIESLPAGTPVPVLQTALLLSQLGKKDEAFRLLESAYNEHYLSLPNMFALPLDGLQTDPRYEQLRRKMNL